MEPSHFTLSPLSLNPVTRFYDSVPYVPPPNELVVTGTGFGTKPFSAPIIWETFANGTPGDLVSTYDSRWVGYNGFVGGVISNLNPRFAGHKSAYNDASRSEFDTNFRTTESRKGRTRYVSYWTRVNYRENYELGGQIKFTRSSSSVASGGDGVYSGAGAHLLNAPAPKSWQSSFYPSSGISQAIGYLTGSWFPSNRWQRIEHEIYLSDLDVPNGFYNVHCKGYGSLLSGNIMQRVSGYGKDNFLLDSCLLGLETVNTEKWVTPSVLAANTTYTYTCTKGSTYVGTWTSGGTVPTGAQVVSGITANLLAAGVPGADIRTNPANTAEFGMFWQYSVSYGANLVRTGPISVQQSETYEDDDFKRFYIGDANTWASCVETHPQPYTYWSDAEVRLSKYIGAITGQTWLYKQLLPATTPIRVGEVVGTTIVYG